MPVNATIYWVHYDNISIYIGKNMLKRLRRKKLVLAGGDLLLIIASFYLSYAIRHGAYINVVFSYTEALVFSVIVFISLFYIVDIYNLERKLYRIGYLTRLVIAIIIANSIIAIVIYFFDPLRYSRTVIVLNYPIIFLLLLFWRYIYEGFFRLERIPSRVLIVGASTAGKKICGDLDRFGYFKVIGFLDDDEEKKGLVIGSTKVIGDTSLLTPLAENKKIDIVVIAITHVASPLLLTKILNVKFNGVDTYDMPTFYEHITGKIPILHISDSWLGYADFYGIRRNIYNTKVKVVLDMILAVFGIIVTFPLMIVVVIAIKIGSRRSVFFLQERVGKNARIFKVVKFRTMECGRENERNLAGLKSDPRITNVGRVLRFFRIDEIPQFWNVLKGEMSVVGPRSLIKEEVDVFTEKVPYFSLRHSVRPGISGWAQVHYKHGTKVEDALEKLQYDLFYVKNLSLILDLHIIIKTLKVMLFGKGAR